MLSELFRAAIGLALISTCAYSQTNVANFWGSSANLHVGASSDEIGDINNDGYHDMVVGAPNPGGTGAVYFVSGYYLKTGNGVASLGATFSTVTDGLFGACVLSVGDVTGDGVTDVLVGKPGTGSPSDGYVHLVSGASKSIVFNWSRADSTFGTSLARCGDLNGDGYTDAMIGCPTAASGGASVLVISPRNGQILANIIGGAATGFGTAVSAGDINDDGVMEFVVGNPNTGFVYVYTYPYLSGYASAVQNVFGFGYSLDASRDFDHDGNDDILVGSPNAETVWLLSGSAITSGSGSGPQLAGDVDLANWTNGVNGSGFGYALTTTPDTNGDLANDIVIGAPWYDSIFPASNNRGAIYFYSGDTLTQTGRAFGVSAGEELGSSISRAWNYDDNWPFEIAAGAPLSNHGATDGGILRLYSLFPTAPQQYCTAKVNSQGCTPNIYWNTAQPSLSSNSPCNITAVNVLNNKFGILFYGYYPNATAFQGGFLCVKSPTKRTPVQQSGGNATPEDCSGVFSFDFNALIQGGTDAGLTLLGQEVFCQYWSRDPASPSTTSLTAGLRLGINP